MFLVCEAERTGFEGTWNSVSDLSEFSFRVAGFGGGVRHLALFGC